jgi:hypothetical protein
MGSAVSPALLATPVMASPGQRLGADILQCLALKPGGLEVLLEILQGQQSAMLGRSRPGHRQR